MTSPFNHKQDYLSDVILRECDVICQSRSIDFDPFIPSMSGATVCAASCCSPGTGYQHSKLERAMALKCCSGDLDAWACPLPDVHGPFLRATDLRLCKISVRIKITRLQASLLKTIIFY